MHDSWLSSVMLLVHTTLATRGLDADAIVQAAGVEPAQLRDPEQRIPLYAAKRLWVAAVHAVDGDPCFGLDVARNINPTTLHAVGFAWTASANLREATTRLVRYMRVINSVDEIELREEDGAAWLVWKIDGELTLPRTYDARLATLMRLCRAIAGIDFVPVAVRLMQAAPGPACMTQMREFFGVEPEYGAVEYAIGLPLDELDRALPAGNASLALAAEKIAAEYLGRHAQNDVVAQVRRCLIELLPSGKLSRAKVARRLAMSERTMQRRLGDAGETFAGLAESLRHELAKDYLRASQHSINEIAYLLGFAEVASFTRAFRRWTGQAPSGWRESQLT